MIEQLMAMPKYEAYKDSGVEWLGKIPANWKVEKGKWLFLKADRPVRNDDDVVTCFRDGQVTLRKNRRTEGFTNAVQEHGYQGIREGDLVIHAMDAFAGAIGVSDSDGKSSPVYSACIPRIDNTVDVYFYAYFLRNLALTGFIESLAKGIRERSTDFRFKDFANLSLLFPPLPEQIAIAAFLDRKTTQIDQAVAIKVKQIALLKERKQILIQNAVTRGLKSDAPMRDSGVEWIGEIPAHWELHRLKRFAQINPSIGTFNRKSRDLVCFLPMENIGSDGAVDYSNKQEIRLVSQGFTQFQKGDVLIAKITPCFENGKSAHLKFMGSEIGFGSTEFHVLRTRENLLAEYLYYIVNTNTFLQMGEALMTGSAGQKRVPTSFVTDYMLVLPPLAEQATIINHIETESAKIDQAISLQQQQIDKLKEYKITLIDSAVTGKIRIPELLESSVPELADSLVA